ncbi:MAG: hypothetical protein MJK04_30925, partial [Psychrosphaera sp.]|nr:hypothetical protein [Psychrosphaera sp.]
MDGFGQQPDLDFRGELFIPAFVEGYVAIGAGLGASVIIGSVTGGIEAMATAGIYGAVSVKPLLQYNDGDWTMSGTAVMAAGARFKLSLNAWAEAEAFWITVWGNTWELAAKTWAFGPDLALQFKLQDYVLGSGAVPQITMEDPDMGNVDSMISDAMPKDSPAPAGGKAAMKQQQADWKGKSDGAGKQQGLTSKQQQAANKSPKDDLKAKSGVNVPSKPSGKKPPPPKAGKDKNKGKDKGKNNKNKTKGDTTVQDKDAPKSKGPRHPANISIDELKKPPVVKPRTTEHKKQDLAAAGKMFDVVKSKAKNFDQLDDYFSQIKRRYALTDIKLVTNGPDGYDVLMSINPAFRKGASVRAAGSGIVG